MLRKARNTSISVYQERTIWPTRRVKPRNSRHSRSTNLPLPFHLGSSLWLESYQVWRDRALTLAHLCIHSFIRAFVHSFYTHLLSVCSIPGMVLTVGIYRWPETLSWLFWSWPCRGVIDISLLTIIMGVIANWEPWPEGTGLEADENQPNWPIWIQERLPWESEVVLGSKGRKSFWSRGGSNTKGQRWGDRHLLGGGHLSDIPHVHVHRHLIILTQHCLPQVCPISVSERPQSPGQKAGDSSDSFLPSHPDSISDQALSISIPYFSNPTSSLSSFKALLEI